ncbi:MAG: hypothetical protein PHV06_08640, partial [bacterium]|nr:hypothetical protein [bacterium]
MIAAHFGFDPLSMGKVDTGKNALLFQGIFMIISPTAVTALILLFVHIHNQKIRYILENGIYAKAILHDIQTTGV